jgi:hypothetical protein
MLSIGTHLKFPNVGKLHTGGMPGERAFLILAVKGNARQAGAAVLMRKSKNWKIKMHEPRGEKRGAGTDLGKVCAGGQVIDRLRVFRGVISLELYRWQTIARVGRVTPCAPLGCNRTARTE